MGVWPGLSKRLRLHRHSMSDHAQPNTSWRHDNVTQTMHSNTLHDMFERCLLGQGAARPSATAIGQGYVIKQLGVFVAEFCCCSCCMG
jgi:hypothetical protein